MEKIVENVYLFLENKFKNIPIQIWICKPQTSRPDLLYKHGEIGFIPKPGFPIGTGNDRYILDQQHNTTILSLFYPSNYQIIICFLDKQMVLDNKTIEYLYMLLSITYANERIQLKERESETLVESIRSITSSLDVNELLIKIIRNALAVIHAADAGYLQLYDPETDCLLPKTAVGFNENIQSFKVKIGESITGRVFQEGTPVIYHSRSEIYNAMSKISKENFLHIQHATDNKYLKALISVPITMGKKRIGVMTVHQFHQEGKLTDHDVSLLQGFAAQAAIAIHNAQLYTELKMRLEDVTELTNQLMEKNQFLLKRNEVHQTLTQLSLQNKGQDVIISELARMMDRDVFFYDYLEAEYYPKTKTTYPYFVIAEISKILKKNREPFYFDGSESKTANYYIYPILSGTVFLGCFIVDLQRKLSQLDQISIEQGGSILALELVKKRTQAEVYYKKSHEIFKELLQNKDPKFLLTKGKELRLNLSSFLLVVLFEIVYYQDLQNLEATVHRLVSGIKRKISASAALVFGFHNKVTMLCSFADSTRIEEFINLLKSILKEWENNDDPALCVGVSTSYIGIENISICYDEANKALSYLTDRNKIGIMRYDEIGINRLFLNQPPQEIQNFLDEIFYPLRTEKAKSNDLENTLFTYIKLNRSTIQTAEKLHIHTNTLYHRIKKIEELLNINMNDLEDLLKILLACHLQESFKK
ncbi:GAF domain-containing protein [Fodinisporobacter ferrooxydans]|uniref:GAF domain-containing protein n=1 Tax=Fodinisporobacter ferrooxydans TaxID=2901836 RepID=A0ABY4CFN4_9BACL|nr:GAF domain-containing protein [Alicyclobacillaceae bacterium MYW30-H2]